MEKQFKKAIIFDCDNTLWQGVIGEGEITHLPIQGEIVDLANKGIIIGICSKNNEADVKEPLAVLDQYISVKRINWKDKVSNMKEIAQELNIGLDAIVFVDDSPFERELMQTHLPEALSIHPDDLRETVEKWFNPLGDITKTRQYKENYARMKYEEQFTDINEFLASLQMVLTIRKNETSHAKRITEMTQKTNQFNLTTLRLTEAEINSNMIWHSVYSLSVKDKFGDHGITGACIVHDKTILIFLLSCRILGKGIEYAFLDYIIEDLGKAGYRQVYAEYIPSGKNQQTENFYLYSGFENIQSAGKEKIYYLDITNYTPKGAKHFIYE